MSRASQRPPQKQHPRTAVSSPLRTRVGSSTNVGSSSSPRPRTKSTPKTSAGILPMKSPDHVDSASVRAKLDIREAIALKRAEVKRSAFKSSESGVHGIESLQDALPVFQTTDDDVADLGRWSVRQTIERARSTGSINLSSRSLLCLPSALFEIHLGITPDCLASVPNEPPIDSSRPATLPEDKAKQQAPSWFEAQDLLTLKAWNNHIAEIQPEIYLFGSLKVIDLHQNKIKILPDTFADLVALTSLDLSHNEIEALPSKIFALPNLTYLNLSHNALKSISFSSPFSDPSFHTGPNRSEDSFFAPIISRAGVPLPSLLTLNVSGNRIPASSIDHDPGSLPNNLSKFDLSGNPLVTENSGCQSLLRALAKLVKLKELRLENTGIGANEFASHLLSVCSDFVPFPGLETLDLGGTEVTVDIARAALSTMNRVLVFDATDEKAVEGAVRVTVGRKVVKETWEIDTGQRSRTRPTQDEGHTSQTPTTVTSNHNGEETTAAGSAADVSIDQKPAGRVPHDCRAIVREPWEIEAEQGLLTEGGRRRARIMAAAAAARVKDQDLSTALPPSPEMSSNTFPVLSISPYYSAATQTLTLPPSVPPSKSSGHSRTFSLAVSSSSNPPSSARTTDVAVPTPTVPLTVITVQPFAPNLRVLVLANRRLDRSFSLPFAIDGGEGYWLPNLEELILEGCGFTDKVNVSRAQTAGSGDVSKSSEMLLPLLARLFPNLRTLDLSYNLLTSASLMTDILVSLILSSSGEENRFPRKGLKHLRLRGNKITDLDGLRGVAELFRSNRDVPTWKLDELDLRDNEITKLPPALGLMPLDVFLVDGNLFRVPQRRIWEREGTKGLLSWLRGRIE